MTIQTAVLIETLRALGVAQYFLDAGSRRRRDRRDPNAGMSGDFNGH
jgi:hypothetical protein